MRVKPDNADVPDFYHRVHPRTSGSTGTLQKVIYEISEKGPSRILQSFDMKFQKKNYMIVKIYDCNHIIFSCKNYVLTAPSPNFSKIKKNREEKLKFPKWGVFRFKS